MRKFIYIVFFIFPLIGLSQTDTIAHLYAFGGVNNDNAEEIQATSDGGYIIIGSTSSNSSGNTDAYLLKVDSLCNYEWSVALGGTNNDWGYSVKQTFDKGYIIAASSNSYGAGGYDALLIKRDSLGGFVWKKTYGGQDWDFAYSVVQTHDSGYVFCGETYNNTNGFSDVYIVKTNPLGDTLWTKTIGGSLIDKGNAVIETSDSNIVVAGIRNTITDSTQAYVIKLNRNGALLWDSIYGDNLFENANSIVETVNGNYIFVGATNSNSTFGDQDYLVKAINSSGSFLWDFTITNGTSPDDNEEAYSIYELSTTNILISGYSATGGSSKNVVVFELTSAGGWTGKSSVIGSENDDVIKSISRGNNGNIVFAGFTYSFGAGNQDVLLVRLDTIYGGQDTSMISFLDATPISVNEINAANKNILIYPNPTYNYFNLSTGFEVKAVKIYNVRGGIVLDFTKNLETIDISLLKKGFYFVDVESELKDHYQIKIIKY